MYVCKYVLQRSGWDMSNRDTKLFAMNMEKSLHAALKRAALDRDTSMAELVESGLNSIGIGNEKDESSEKDSRRK